MTPIMLELYDRPAHRKWPGTTDERIAVLHAEHSFLCGLSVQSNNT